MADWFGWLLERIPDAKEKLHELADADMMTALRIVAGIACGVIIAFITSSETIKLIWKTALRSKAAMEAQLTQLEKRNSTLHAEIDTVRAENEALKKQVTDEVKKHPETAIATAEYEFGEGNTEPAITHLEAWVNANAGSLNAIALHLAKYHIAAAIPLPADHLKRADQMLRLARGAVPDNPEARDLFNEFSAVNAELQERILRAGDVEVPWNEAMAATTPQGRLSLVLTLEKVAELMHQRGLPRLTPLFADRASDLARGGGAALRGTWFRVEGTAAFYLSFAGHNQTALARLDHLLARMKPDVTDRDLTFLTTRYYRASVLRDLGRPGDALEEIDRFAPIEEEVKGPKHPDTLTTRHLRASVLRDLGRPGDALEEIDRFAPIQEEVKGPKHPGTLNTRYLRASVLQDLGRPGDALEEIDRFAPIQEEVKGPKHPGTLNTRYLRASVLQDLGRPGDALEEIDRFAPIEEEVKGPKHPHTLTTRHLRASVLRDLGRPGDALEEIDRFAPIQEEVKGPKHPDTLITRSLRASVLQALGRPGDALEEIDRFAPIEEEVKGPKHPHTLGTKSLRIGIEIASGRGAGQEGALRDIIAGLTAALTPPARQTLRARYRLARLSVIQGRTGEAARDLRAIAADFDPKTDPNDWLFRSVRALLTTAEGGPPTDGLIT